MLKPSFYRALFVFKDGEELDLKKLANRLGVSNATVKRYVRELVKLGYIVESKPGLYKLTGNGLLFKKSISNLLDKTVEEPLGYVFTDPYTGSPIPLRIRSLEQLYAIVKYGLIPENILQEHLTRGYLSKWVKEVLGDYVLAEAIKEGTSLSIKEFLELVEERIKIVRSIKEFRAL